MTKTGVSMYFTTFICLYTSCWAFSLVIFQVLAKVVSSDWIHFPHSDRGVVNWLFWPLRTVQLSSHFAYTFPTASILKLYSCFWSDLSMMVCKGLKSQSYKWVKICVFGDVQPSVMK